jgi:tetraacyldisaccharide 4'-kinase
VLAAPLSWLWRAGAGAASRRAAAQAVRVEGLRVVSVGNLSVGGTGKTPVAAWVCRLLADAGERPALVARGYGRDELLLHRRWNPEVPVEADPDRVAAARVARGAGATVAVLDDGFQHRRLARDVDLVLLAAEEPLPARVLPRGPWREGLGALQRAHAVVVTRRTAAQGRARALATGVRRVHPHLVVGRLALLPGAWSHLDGAPAEAPEPPVLVATAVARPGAVRDQVAARIGGSAELLAFADHHDFTPADVRRIRSLAGGRAVVVTEKDAVKLAPLAELLGPSRVLLQDLRWEEGEAELRSAILDPAHRES